MTDPNRADLELHVTQPEPAPRRLGCSVFAVAAVLALAWLLPRPMCRNYGGWHRFEDETGFGYMDWVCQLPRGHRGDHWGSSS